MRYLLNKEVQLKEAEAIVQEVMNHPQACLPLRQIDALVREIVNCRELVEVVKLSNIATNLITIMAKELHVVSDPDGERAMGTLVRTYLMNKALQVA